MIDVKSSLYTVRDLYTVRHDRASFKDWQASPANPVIPGSDEEIETTDRHTNYLLLANIGGKEIVP